MADAGRILIIPKGDYDANSTYEKLDLVKYKGTSWLAKKNATGVEPSKENSEFWQDVFEANIANNLTTTEEGYALDARQGKALNDRLSIKSDYFINALMAGTTRDEAFYTYYNSLPEFSGFICCIIESTAYTYVGYKGSTFSSALRMGGNQLHLLRYDGTKWTEYAIREE